MILKKMFLVALLPFLIVSPVFSADNSNTFKEGVSLYKSENYIKSRDVLIKSVNSDPANALAHYYLAMCFVKLGDVDKARKEYEKVVKINEEAVIAIYAKKGIELLDAKSLGNSNSDNDNNKNNSQNNFMNGYMAPPPVMPVNNEIDNKSKDKSKNKNSFNENQQFMPPMVYPTNDKVDKKDNSKYPANFYNPIPMQLDNPAPKSNQMPNNKSMLENEINGKNDLFISENKVENSNKTQPTDTEIKKAYETLSKAGMGNSYSNPELLQMQMMMGALGGNGLNNGMMGNNSINPMASLMPMMMLSQQGNNNEMNSGLMEAMINNMMMPSLMSIGNDNNNNSGGFGF